MCGSPLVCESYAIAGHQPVPASDGNSCSLLAHKTFLFAPSNSRPGAYPGSDRPIDARGGGGRGAPRGRHEPAGLPHGVCPALLASAFMRHRGDASHSSLTPASFTTFRQIAISSVI